MARRSSLRGFSPPKRLYIMQSTMAVIRIGSSKRRKSIYLNYILVTIATRMVRRVDAFLSTAKLCRVRSDLGMLRRSCIQNEYFQRFHDSTNQIVVPYKRESSTIGKSTLSEMHVSSVSDGYKLKLRIPTAEDMEDIGGILSVDTKAGDVILLDGDLGAGKTCFSRGFIRARTGMKNERVTSPTYLLSNSYLVDESRTTIYHMDLYRLSGSDNDLLPLDLGTALSKGISLIEWPSRLRKKPKMRLDITLTIVTTENNYDITPVSRCMLLEPHGYRWKEKLHFLETEGYFDDLIMDV